MTSFRHSRILLLGIAALKQQSGTAYYAPRRPIRQAWRVRPGTIILTQESFWHQYCWLSMILRAEASKNTGKYNLYT